jgi:hypothetical protein
MGLQPKAKTANQPDTLKLWELLSHSGIAASLKLWLSLSTAINTSYLKTIGLIAKSIDSWKV